MNNLKVKGIIISLVFLVLVIGISFAYFMSNVSVDGDGNGAVDVQTVNLDDGSTISVDGTIEFNDLNVYPGHKNVSAINVAATGGKTSFYNLTWTGTNSLNTPLNFTVYKSRTEEAPTVNCTKVRENKMYYETCEASGFENLETPVATGTIPKTTTSTKYVLKDNESIAGGSTVYYYIVLEYPNLPESQNIDVNGKFEGITTIEVLRSSFVPKLELVSSESTADSVTVKVKGTDAASYYYKIGNQGYVNSTSDTYTFTGLESDKEYEFMVYAVNDKGESSAIISDKIKTAQQNALYLIANAPKGTGTPDYTKTSCADGCNEATNGLYQWSGTDYSGGTNSIYYYRGTVDNNWVKFGKDGSNDIWWRIIRTNSTGGIRMIYAGVGTSAPATTGTGTQINGSTGVAFNPHYSKNYYVGLQYATNSMHGNSTNAPILGETSSTDATKTLYGFYNQKLSADDKTHIDITAGFCSDRNSKTNSSATIDPTGDAVSAGVNTAIYYSPYIRAINSKIPKLTCANTSDKLNLSVGLITSDEVMMAGGLGGTNNSGFWLNTGQAYWTMSPYRFGGSNAFVFHVDSSGNLNNPGVSNTYGVRPVINLKSTTIFQGSGTTSDPYVVVSD